MPPAAAVDEVKQSHQRGRGGAEFLSRPPGI